MGWDEHEGLVTAAFVLWRMADEEQRTYLLRTAEVIDAANDAVWSTIPPDDPESRPGELFQPPDRIDRFFDQVGGLMPDDHHWLLCASVLKDAVTTFDVYLESALDEVCLRNERKTIWEGKRTPDWRALRRAWRDELAVDLAVEDVNRIRTLRHLLTHRRGICTTAAEIELFAVPEGDRIPLDEESVLSALAVLGDTVRRVDPAAKDACWLPDEGAGTFG